MNTKIIKGIFIVSMGAASYGVLAVMVKLGGQDGYSTGELTFSQSFIGLLLLLFFNMGRNVAKPQVEQRKIPVAQKWKLMLGGIPFGLTSSFYYLSLTYTSVSVCIVMLMQSVWIGSVIDFVINKNKPTPNKIIAIIIVLAGTILATNLFSSDIAIDWRGIFWGLMAALSYSVSLLVSNNVATGYRPLSRSLYIIAGSATVVTLIWGYSLFNQFDPSVLWKWGIPIALFGTVLPPLLFTKGIPVIGVGLGSILASIELPVSVTMARIVLGEQINISQLLGIILILLAVVIMNISYLKPSKSH
ncbi:DMT family transporter [Dysgonomonas capnocytophagoides]|uniref:DMT family transporter n=1 Tax=Dysgonomonas capnocytophagoides TaxID=45254 RepID=UPI002926E6C8|nr:DMT family transporter [Dysgonomonas capnocytophagoides]